MSLHITTSKRKRPVRNPQDFVQISEITEEEAQWAPIRRHCKISRRQRSGSNGNAVCDKPFKIKILGRNCHYDEELRRLQIELVNARVDPPPRPEGGRAVRGPRCRR